MSLMDMLLNEPSAQDQALQIIGMTQGGTHDPRASASTGLQSLVPGPAGSLQDPWNVDPNGETLVTRHGETFDKPAMHSLMDAWHTTGINPFPYMGESYRSVAESNALHNARYDANGNLIPGNLPAAPGGQSMHNYGLAFDAGSLPDALRSWLLSNGWYNGASWGDAPHYSFGRNG